MSRFVFRVVAALCLSFAAAFASPAEAKTCEITNYGAIANDALLDDEAISKAIADCAGVGGKVRVPTGVFLTGGVQLRSNLEFHLSGGAVLRGAARLADYRTVTGLGGAELERAETDASRGILAGVGVRDVTISGTGTIDGAGAGFWADLVNRPDFSLALSGCSNVRIRDIRLIDPAKYHMRLQSCDDVVVTGVSIRAPATAPNSDGIQVRDSADVRISDCLIDTGDDAIVLKAHTRAVERITITNCNLSSDDAALKFGTGSHTAVRDVNVSGVTVTRARYGIALFMQDGGVYENNRFADMIISTGSRHRRDYPIYVDIDSRFSDKPTFGAINGLVFDGIDIRTKGAILIGGQPGAPVRDLALRDIRMRVTAATGNAALAGKPRGNRLQDQRTGAADFSAENGHLVIGHAERVTLRGLDLSGASPGDRRPQVVTREVRAIASDANYLPAR